MARFAAVRCELLKRSKKSPEKAQTKPKMLSGVGRFARYYIDREPVVVMAFAIGTVAVSLPLVVVPLRRSMGLPTDQYDGPIVPESFKKSRGYLAPRTEEQQ